MFGARRYHHYSRVYVLRYLVCFSLVLSLNANRGFGQSATLDDVVAELQGLNAELYENTYQTLVLQSYVDGLASQLSTVIDAMTDPSDGIRASLIDVESHLSVMREDLFPVMMSGITNLANTVTKSPANNTDGSFVQTADYYNHYTYDQDYDAYRSRIMNWSDLFDTEGVLQVELSGGSAANSVSVDFGNDQNPEPEVETNDIPDVITNHRHYNPDRGGLDGDEGFAATMVSGFTESVMTNSAIPALWGSVTAPWSDSHRQGDLDGFSMVGALLNLQSTNGVSVLPMAAPTLGWVYGQPWPEPDASITGSMPIRGWAGINTRHTDESDGLTASLSGITDFLDFTEISSTPYYDLGNWQCVPNITINGQVITGYEGDNPFHVGVKDTALLATLQPQRTVVRAASSVLAFLVAVWQVLAWWRPNLFRPGLADDLLGLRAGGGVGDTLS